MKFFLSLTTFIFVSYCAAQNYYPSSSKSFFEEGLANDTVRIENLNVELLQAAIFHATNLRRPKKRQLTYDKNLSKGAAFHSLEMQTKRFFSHTNRKNKKYKTPALRAKKFKAKFILVGENIIEEFAVDYKDQSLYDSKLINDKYAFYHHNSGKKIRDLTYKELAEKIVTSWMHSPGHKANILEKNYTHLGVGVATKPNPYSKEDLPVVTVTQLFGGN